MLPLMPSSEIVEAIARMAGKTVPHDIPNLATQLFLPGLDSFLRAMPNQIARSSLFSPVARGKRKMHNETTMVTRGDATMTYSGQQLDEADADLCMQLFQMAHGHELGKPIKITTSHLLLGMGRCTGKQQYLWLRRRMKALTAATFFIEARNPDGSVKYSLGSIEAFHIVERFRYVKELDSWVFVLDPRWASLFAGREFALLDYRKRVKIKRGQDLAKALQRLIATSSNPVQRYNLAWLKAKMQQQGRMRDFKISLLRAGAELKRVKIIASAQINKNSKNQDQLVINLSV